MTATYITTTIPFLGVAARDEIRRMGYPGARRPRPGHLRMVRRPVQLRDGPGIRPGRPGPWRGPPALVGPARGPRPPAPPGRAPGPRPPPAGPAPCVRAATPAPPPWSRPPYPRGHGE